MAPISKDWLWIRNVKVNILGQQFFRIIFIYLFIFGIKILIKFIYLLQNYKAANLQNLSLN